MQRDRTRKPQSDVKIIFAFGLIRLQIWLQIRFTLWNKKLHLPSIILFIVKTYLNISSICLQELSEFVDDPLSNGTIIISFTTLGLEENMPNKYRQHFYNAFKQ